jgi:hypothetical protein
LLLSVCAAVLLAASGFAAPTTKPKSTPSPAAPRPAGQTPAANAEARKAGARLLALYRSGSLKLVNDERDRRYLKQLAAVGYYVSPDRTKACAPAPALLRTFVSLAARSTPSRPLVVLSLYRPPTTLSPRSAHGRGEALDIAGFNGYDIDSDRPVECVNGVLSVVKALPAGRAYRLGLPKPPGTDPKGLLPPPRRPKGWPFFPAPLPRVTVLFGRFPVVVPRRGEDGKFVFDARRGYLAPDVRRWANSARPRSRRSAARGCGACSATSDAGARTFTWRSPTPPTTCTSTWSGHADKCRNGAFRR